MNVPEYQRAIDRALAAYQEAIGNAGEVLGAELARARAEFFNDADERVEAGPLTRKDL